MFSIYNFAVFYSQKMRNCIPIFLLAALIPRDSHAAGPTTADIAFGFNTVYFCPDQNQYWQNISFNRTDAQIEIRLENRSGSLVSSTLPVYVPFTANDNVPVGTRFILRITEPDIGSLITAGTVISPNNFNPWVYGALAGEQCEPDLDAGHHIDGTIFVSLTGTSYTDGVFNGMTLTFPEHPIANDMKQLPFRFTADYLPGNSLASIGQDVVNGHFHPLDDIGWGHFGGGFNPAVNQSLPIGPVRLKYEIDGYLPSSELATFQADWYYYSRAVFVPDPKAATRPPMPEDYFHFYYTPKRSYHLEGAYEKMLGKYEPIGPLRTVIDYNHDGVHDAADIIAIQNDPGIIDP